MLSFLKIDLVSIVVKFKIGTQKVALKSKKTEVFLILD